MDLDITFKCNEIISKLWVASCTNNVLGIIHFLEILIYSNDRECLYYCDEEGIESFLYTKTIDDGNKIRFIHLSKYIDNYDERTDYSINQDIIISKKEFIKTFYNSIMTAVNKITNNDEFEKYLNGTDEFKILKQGSDTIKKYIM